MLADEEDAVWPKRTQRTRFSIIFDYTVWILLVLSALYVGLHLLSTDQYLSTVAARYEAGRMWKESEPERSRESYELEARLIRDLDAYEEEHRPGLDDSWQKIIWQSWRNENLTVWTDSWKELNPDWEYRFLLDSQVDEIVYDTFSGVPDLVDTWKAYPKNVLRFDLFRYLFPWAFGGLYADADTTCTAPVTYWLSPQLWNETSIHTVIGLEFDGPRDYTSWNRAVDYVQYMMLSKPFSPIMKKAVIETIVRSHRLKEAQNVKTLAEVDWSFFNVLKTTGPTTFTDACLTTILDECSKLSSNEDVWKASYGRTKPTRLGNTVVLPPPGWFRGSIGIPGQLIHHGQGSWI